MRDLLLLVMLVATVVAILWRPWIGAIAWAVVSLAAPHEYFGYAAKQWPVATVIAIPTILGLLWAKSKHNPFKFPPIAVYTLLFVWMTIGVPFSFVPNINWELWDRTMKITVMLIVSVALIDTRHKLEVFIWANALSIGFYGIKGGIFTILSGGSATVLGPGGFIFENNGMAMANAMTAPWFLYLQSRLRNKWLKLAAGAAVGLIAIAALGSNSRGALLAVCCMGLYLWIKSKQKVVWGLVIVALVLLVLVLMPESYWDRMSTIKTYKEDESSMGRINAWWTAFHIANDRFFGGGFRNNVSWVFERYSPDPSLLLVEHSIFFQMLGSFGWIGLAMFLCLGVMTWRNAAALIRLGRSDPRLQEAADIGISLQISMVAYGVAGAFLSQALFDLPYNYMAVGALGLHLARREKAALLAGESGSSGSSSFLIADAARNPSSRLTGTR